MKRPILLAHRGFSGKFPENSKRAFEEAIALKKCDGIESDVHLSADGEPVIIHDPVLERTSNGTGFVKDKTFDELKKLDVGSWFAPEFEGERIMHLDELLKMIVDNDILLNLELKNYEVMYPGMEKVVIDRIVAAGAKDRVFLSSFNHISMKMCKDIAPDIKTGFLYGHPMLDVEKYAANYSTDALHPRYTCFHFEEDLVKRIKDAGLSVNTWTVNEEEDMLLCLKLGVDCIISNYPDKLIEVVDKTLHQI